MYIGIDIGSRTAKGVLFDGSSIVDSAVCDTGIHPRHTGESIFKRLLTKNRLQHPDIKKIVGTGYGRVSLEIAHKTVTELSCHAKGANFICPEVRTVLDIGGQDSKVIHVNENGGMEDFIMNDKCAAGTGRFFEIAAKALEMDLGKFCKIESAAERACQINNMCAVFAETEIISLLAKDVPVASIALGINQTFSKRIAGMVRRLGVKDKVLFVGGVAKNGALKKAVSDELDIRFHTYGANPQIMGAIGAAVIASQL